MRIAIVNQKGGCGKTTTAINLSYALSLEGFRILLVDTDPQAHATRALGCDSNFSLYNVLSPIVSEKKSLKEIMVRKNEFLYLIPSEVILSTLEQELSSQEDRERRFLNQIIKEDLDGNFDFIIIDCPPNLGLLTINALRAAEFLVIPMEMSFFSFQALRQLLEILNLFKEKLNHYIDYKILITMVDGRSKYIRSSIEKIKQEYSDKLFETMIHLNVKLKESIEHQKSVFEFDKYARGAKEYKKLCKELISLVGRPYTFQIQNPNANEVYAVGDFNGWQRKERFRLVRIEDGKFFKRTLLRGGVYRYKFLVDGNWVEDPLNPEKVSNPFGGFDSILKI